MQKANSHLVDEATRRACGDKRATFAAHVIEGACDAAPRLATLAVGLTATLFARGPDGAGAVVAAFAAAKFLSVCHAVAAGMAAEAASERNFDSPSVHRLVLALETRASESFAARRGTVWLVTSPDSRRAAVMSDREYLDHKKAVAARGGSLDEVVVGRASVDVRRYVAGKLDAGARRLPATESYALSTGRRTLAEWFRGGERMEASVAARPEGGKGFVPTDFSASRFLREGVGRRAGDDEPLPAPGM